MSKSRRKSYEPMNKPSKRYTNVKVFDAGGWFRGHKSRSADNQSANQQVRTQEKREWKHQITEELCV